MTDRISRHGRYFRQGDDGRKRVASSPARAPMGSRTNLALLTVEEGDKFVYDKPQNVAEGQYIVSKRLSRDNLRALNFLDEGFTDFNDIIAHCSNQDAIPSEIRHYIAWRSALSQTHYKMGAVQTPIPLAALSGLSHRLTKWQRLWRFLSRVLCGSVCVGQYEDATNDYTTRNSRSKFEKFLVDEGSKDVRPAPRHQAAHKARRNELFARFAPSYFHKVELPRFMRK